MTDCDLWERGIGGSGRVSSFRPWKVGNVRCSMCSSCPDPLRPLTQGRAKKIKKIHVVLEDRRSCSWVACHDSRRDNLCEFYFSGSSKAPQTLWCQLVGAGGAKKSTVYRRLATTTDSESRPYVVSTESDPLSKFRGCTCASPRPVSFT